MLDYSLLQNINQLVEKGDFDLVETALKAALESDEHHHSEILVLLARCQLAQQKLAEARHTYQHVQMHQGDEYAAALGEAALVQDDFYTSLDFFKKAIEISENQAEVLALLAVNEYLLGYIKHAAIHLEAAILHEFEWEDDSLIDFVFQQVLPMREFHDFEQIYLDCYNKIHEDKDTQNRWFAINMPIYDIFKASKKETQKKQVQYLATLLSPQFDANFIENGTTELIKILQDLAQSPENAQFGDAVLHAFEKGEVNKVGQLILAVLLEHTEQFSKLFGLSPELVKSMQLQELVPLLPLRMALALMFLYSTSDPKDKIQHFAQQNLDEQYLAALLTASFISYYQQIDLYKSPEKEHFETGYT